MCRGLDSIQERYNRRMLRYPRVVEADTEGKEEKRSKWKKEKKLKGEVFWFENWEQRVLWCRFRGPVLEVGNGFSFSFSK